MCHIYGWIEKGGKVLILTAQEVYHTERGKLTREHCNKGPTEFYGHSAIMFYYVLNGAEYEKTEQSAFWDLFKAIKNRNKLWR